MSDLIHIIIVEDNRRYSESLQQMIELSQGFSLAASYKSVEQYLEGAKTESPTPIDIILLDISLPGKSGLQLMPFLLKDHPNSNIIVLTQNDDYTTALEAIQLGAAGYLIKDTSIQIIRSSIREVHEGACIIDPFLSKAVLKALTSEGEIESDQLLSEREREVLELLALGYVKKEIADQLELGYRTIAQYTENIFKKLRVNNTTSAVATAIRKGLI